MKAALVSVLTVALGGGAMMTLPVAVPFANAQDQAAPTRSVDPMSVTLSPTPAARIENNNKEAVFPAETMPAVEPETVVAPAPVSTAAPAQTQALAPTRVVAPTHPVARTAATPAEKTAEKTYFAPTGRAAAVKQEPPRKPLRVATYARRHRNTSYVPTPPEPFRMNYRGTRLAEFDLRCVTILCPAFPLVGIGY